MPKVEYRTLRLVTNFTGGDHVTVGIVHWDGVHLRSAFAPDRVPSDAPPSRDAVLRTMASIERRIERAADGQLDVGLEHVFRVRAGLGGALSWSSVRRGRASVAEKHFDAIVRKLRLDPPEDREHILSDRELRKQLRELGKQLSQRLEHVRIDQVLRAPANDLHRYKSPLSWKNGQMHHAVAMSMEGKSPDQIGRTVEKWIGRLQMVMSDEDVPVIVAALPRDPRLLAVARDELGVLRKRLEETLPAEATEYVEARRVGGAVSNEELVAMIERHGSAHPEAED
jgi:hypothetical protein